ncbi:glycosyltransferase involved in cell wall biosynthesis [Wenyingzhuangia heitensis]|uniref:Glycosyltransferase involved in cell wall biosynthesis n=1 Tax=Wenyingzhuangia heitensis TaxID=1487859 RepID=A0ABX0UD40_9FLAO|nr:glycosyltransferase [Wenyingzhuangia heitensis]NIJ45386.1 glycosyltransferase involved in cell wall biosynthesis [Wenyingzhuangia heitensis]
MSSSLKLFDLVIVIPSYNESKSLRKKKFFSFLKNHPDVAICFVNDGSTDNTLEILNKYQLKNPSQIFVFDCVKNQGKAGATLMGMNYCAKNLEYTKIAYLDADLATPLKECYRISNKLKGKLSFVFGSRIKKLGSRIERSYFRFFTGRVIATFISNVLKLGVYDTQCGIKVFTKELGIKVFNKPFISKWLFDVEIFFRIIKIYSREQAVEKMKEIPLNKWIDKGDSKVKMSYFFKLWVDLLKINNAYKKI